MLCGIFDYIHWPSVPLPLIVLVGQTMRAARVGRRKGARLGRSGVACGWCVEGGCGVWGGKFIVSLLWEKTKQPQPSLHLGRDIASSTTHQQEDGSFHQMTKYQYLIWFFLVQHKERVVMVEIEAWKLRKSTQLKKNSSSAPLGFFVKRNVSSERFFRPTSFIRQQEYPPMDFQRSMLIFYWIGLFNCESIWS